MVVNPRGSAAIVEVEAGDVTAGTAVWRREFPILSRNVHGQRLVYLDTASSAQKPRCVIDAVCRAYEWAYANVHRGVHVLSCEATEAYEGARETVRRFIGARSAAEIVFVRGATEAINLVAATLGQEWVAGDEVIVSELEHHSNIVPWQMLRDRTGVALKVWPADGDGCLRLDELPRLLTPRTRLIAVTHVANATGAFVPVADVIAMAHRQGVLVLIDGCQAVAHVPVDVQALDADFYVFSGHKAYGPTGIGVMYGKSDLLSRMPPYQGGGDMIRSVTFEHTVYDAPPHRFEAGTPAFVEAVGIATALDFLTERGLGRIAAHESALAFRAVEALRHFPEVRLIGAGGPRGAIVSFVYDGAHPHDVATILDRQGIAVRAGHHCAQPLMAKLGVAATVRASFGLYNGDDDVVALCEGLREVAKVFG